MAEQQTPFVSQDPSISTVHERTVEDEIRLLVPESAQISALIAKGQVSKTGVKFGKGMISKKSSTTRRVEAFTHTPVDITITPTAVSGLVLTFASVAGLHVRQVWRNTANNTVGSIDLISSTDVTFVSEGATFTTTEGDVLQRLAVNYEENSSDPAYVQKPDDNLYNVMQIVRFPVAISASANANKPLAGGDYLKRMKMYAGTNGMRDLDRTFIWGQRQTTTTTDVTSFSNLGVNISHMRGLWFFAQNSYNAGGNMTPTKMRKDLILSMDRSVGNNQPLIMLTSREARARFIEWQDEKLMILQSGNLKEFGIKSDTFITSGPDIHVVAHDAFDYGSDVNKALLFIPENVQYRFRAGRDLHPKKGIQSNSTDGFVDEILGEVSMLPLDNGYSITKVTNLF